MPPNPLLKQDAWEANLAICCHRLAILTFGNVSVCDRRRSVFAIKPSGVPYELLTLDDMVVVDFDGNPVEGSLRPSSDTPTHALLYREMPDIGGICHTHSTYATAWAQAMQPVPVFGTTHADVLAMDIPCTPMIPDAMVAGNYEEETGRLILQTLEGFPSMGISMILVAGHGPFTWGKDAVQAVEHSVMLEEICRLAYLTRQIRPDTERLKESLIEKHYQRKHGPGATYGQGGEHLE